MWNKYLIMFYFQQNEMFHSANVYCVQTIKNRLQPQISFWFLHVSHKSASEIVETLLSAQHNKGHDAIFNYIELVLF